VIKFVDKTTPVIESVMEDLLFFLIESYLKLVLYNTSEVGYCKVNFDNIYYELCQVGIKVKTTLE